jgi:predicted transposase/invertase (TIGR01784 family)
MTSLSESEREQYRQHLLEVPWEYVVESAREQGLEEGIEKGIRQVAKSMLSQGLSLESISKATGLSQKEISKLS